MDINRKAKQNHLYLIAMIRYFNILIVKYLLIKTTKDCINKIMDTANNK